MGKITNYLDPVFKDWTNKWYFYDETWTDPYGPYFTEEQCRRELRYYCLVYLGMSPNYED